jgi:hypothetical protein
MINKSVHPEISDNALKKEPRRCLYCGQYAELIWVHGHGQCAHCGINTEECCQGENCAFNQNR